MQNNGKIIRLGEYEISLLPGQTRTEYEKLSVPEELDIRGKFFQFLFSRASRETLSFLEEMGIDPKKLYVARPLSEPDEKGEILFFCCARLCGTLLSGGDTVPRQSVEHAGFSMVFLSDPVGFQSGLVSLAAPELEIRFVISLPFDPSFFGEKEE